MTIAGKTVQGARAGTLLARDAWWETVLAVLTAAVLLVIMTQPAFGSFFLAEDFIYLGQYRAQGNDYWRGVFSATDRIFFRPVFSAANLLWQFVLPLDPWVHHVRNAGFTVLTFLVLHRILVHLVQERWARLLALLFFTVSKIHLTNIGYINVYDSIVSLLLLLLTVLFFLRYIEWRRPYDYGLGLLWCGLAIFTKDYGLVIAGVVLALVAVRGMTVASWRGQYRWWAVRLAPLPLMIAGYLVIRAVILGSLPIPGLTSAGATSMGVYAPQLDSEVILRKAVVFIGTLANLSYPSNGTSGAGGIGAWVGSQTGIAFAPFALEALVGALLGVLALGSLLVSRRRWWALLFPLVWIAIYFGPTLLTRNLQMYYMYEPMAGVAILLGMCLDSAGHRLLGFWRIALVMIGANGLVSNYTSLYHWQFAANNVARVYTPVVEKHRGQMIDSITFITAGRSFWQWGLTADFKGPMIPELMRLPHLSVRFIDYTELATNQTRVDARNLFFDIDNGFLAYEPAKPSLTPILQSISPSRAAHGSAFNLQPDGRSALVITTMGATPGTAAVMGETRLATSYHSPTQLIALVPAELLAVPGHYPVYLTTGITTSNALEFVVSREPARLVLHHLAPAATQAGQAFNLQPDGQAVLSIACENAAPGTTVIFDGTPLTTFYGGERWLTAFVPRALYSRPGRYEVYLKQGVAESNRLTFAVDP